MRLSRLAIWLAATVLAGCALLPPPVRCHQVPQRHCEDAARATLEQLDPGHPPVREIVVGTGGMECPAPCAFIGSVAVWFEGDTAPAVAAVVRVDEDDPVDVSILMQPSDP